MKTILTGNVSPMIKRVNSIIRTEKFLKELDEMFKVIIWTGIWFTIGYCAALWRLSQ